MHSGGVNGGCSSWWERAQGMQHRSEPMSKAGGGATAKAQCCSVLCVVMRCGCAAIGEPENACSCDVLIQPAAPTHSNGEQQQLVGSRDRRGDQKRGMKRICLLIYLVLILLFINILYF